MLSLEVNKTSFYKILSSSLLDYVSNHSFLKNDPFKIWPTCNLQKYMPGQSYSIEHCENDDGTELIALRTIAWMFYLNDIDSDGGTCFPSQKTTLVPKEGDLYIWPAYWTHSHYGLASERELKYILTGWCRYLIPSERKDLFNKLTVKKE